jgi:hypothetical protein
VHFLQFFDRRSLLNTYQTSRCRRTAQLRSRITAHCKPTTAPEYPNRHRKHAATCLLLHTWQNKHVAHSHQREGAHCPCVSCTGYQPRCVVARHISQFEVCWCGVVAKVLLQGLLKQGLPAWKQHRGRHAHTAHAYVWLESTSRPRLKRRKHSLSTHRRHDVTSACSKRGIITAGTVDLLFASTKQCVS